MTAESGFQIQTHTLMKKYITIAAIAALGFTACEEKSVDAKKDDAKKQVDKAADKAKTETNKAVDKAADAAGKVAAGASLVQLSTGLIYSGPELIEECVTAIRRRREGVA